MSGDTPGPKLIVCKKKIIKAMNICLYIMQFSTLPTHSCYRFEATSLQVLIRNMTVVSSVYFRPLRIQFIVCSIQGLSETFLCSISPTQWIKATTDFWRSIRWRMIVVILKRVKNHLTWHISNAKYTSETVIDWNPGKLYWDGSMVRYSICRLYSLDVLHQHFPKFEVS